MATPGTKPDLRVVKGRERGTVPEPASHLGEYGREAWDGLSGEARRLGIIGALDWVVFEKACEQYELARVAWDEIKRLGVVVAGRADEHKKNPAISTYASASQELRMLLNEMGFTPTSRQRLELPDEKEKSVIESIRERRAG